MNEIEFALSLFNEIHNIEEKLRSNHIIRSNKVKEDYGEWLAAKLFNREISEKRNEKYWDIKVGEVKYQVKAHRKAGTNKAKWSSVKSLNYPVIIIELNQNYTIKNLYLLSVEKLNDRFKDGQIKRNKKKVFDIEWLKVDIVNNQFTNDYPYLFE